MKKKKSSAPGVLLALGVILTGAGIWAQQQGYIFADDENGAIEGALVRRGSLEFTITERGNLTAKNSASIKSEVEGRSTLLFLIEEGTQVQAGDLVAEIDTSELKDRRVAQEIIVQSARATATKTREAVEIQRIENESLIAKAEQDVQFARLEVEKYIGSTRDGLSEMAFEEVISLATEGETNGFSGGNREQELQQYRDDILIREEERKRAEDTLTWSQQLAEKGFVERTELEADELAYTRAGILLEQAKRAMFLLERYEQPKYWAQLRGDHDEARRQLRKARKQEVAKLADFEAAKQSAVVKLQLEEEKLARIVDQVAKGRLYAPVAGMAVYGRTQGSRYSGGEPVQEGGEVRERQEIVSIPGEGGMVAEASIHESALTQVVSGLAVTLRVDALPGQAFHGVVGRVAVLPDKNSFWANPNLRLYKTEIVVDEVAADMRPGMSCSIEIHVDNAEDVLYVPVQAVHHSAGHPIAWVSAAGEIEPRAVQIGRNNEKWLEVLEGLEEGELVLLSPPLGFQPEEDSAPSRGAPEQPAAHPKGAKPAQPGPSVGPGGGSRKGQRAGRDQRSAGAGRHGSEGTVKRPEN